MGTILRTITFLVYTMQNVFIHRNRFRGIIIVRSLKFELSHLSSLELMYSSKEKHLLQYIIVSNTMNLSAEFLELAVGNHSNKNVKILNASAEFS